MVSGSYSNDNNQPRGDGVPNLDTKKYFVIYARTAGGSLPPTFAPYN